MGLKTEKAILKYAFETKDLVFLYKLKPKFFKNPVAKTVLKALQSYVNTFNTIPSYELFNEKLKTKLPDEKAEAYTGFVEGLSLLEIDASGEELYDLIVQEYKITVIDEHIEDIVETAKEKDLDSLQQLINQLQGQLVINDKLPEDIVDTEYTPAKIRLISPFMPTMQQQNLMFAGVTLVGGSTGGGKSLFTMNQLLYSYDKEGYNVCLLNLELGFDETLARMYSYITKTPFNEVYGNTDDGMVEKINQWKKEFFGREKNKFYIKNTRLSISDITAIIKAMHKQGVTVFGLDYIQIVDADTNIEEWKQLRDLVRELHRLAQELGIVIITPVQVNMHDVKEKDGELKIHVRGSKELENSSSVFLFIYQTKEEFEDNVARVFTLKARNAKKNTYMVQTEFDKMTFVDTGIIL